MRRRTQQTLVLRKRSNVYLLESLPAVLIPLLFKDLVNLILNLMVIFVFVTIAPGVMLGLICSKGEVMGSNVMGKRWKIAYWSMLGVVVVTGLVTVPTLLGVFAK